MKQFLKFLVISSIIAVSFQDTVNNEVNSQEENPFAGITKEILKEKNLENIGGMLGSFLQSDGGKMILDGIMEKVTDPQNIGQISQILNSVSTDTKNDDKTVQQTKNQNDDVNPMELLSGLGSIVGALQGGNGESGEGSAALLQGLGSLLSAGQGGNNAAGLIQGLGSILGAVNTGNKKENDNGGAAILQGLGSLVAAAAANNQGGEGNNLGILEGLGSLLGDQNGQGGISPELIGNVINMFSPNEKESPKSKRSVESKPKKSKKTPKKKKNEFDLADAINLASSFLNSDTSGKGKGGASLMDYLPMILNTVNAFTGPEAKQRADSHAEHKGAIPAILEKVHVFFDNFLHSDMAQNILNYMGTEKAFKTFQDENGQFSYNRFQELIENHSFRKHWIKQITQRLVDFLKFLAYENTQNKYIFTGLSFVNVYLKSNGFPENALINTKNPVKSITNFVNYAAKKYLDADNVDAKEYVKPAVLYIQDLLKMARQAVAVNKEPTELIDKLTDTINMDFIEPITRVNRAYRFTTAEPTCDRYVFCLINQQTSNSGSLPSLNKGLSKGSSLIAAWFASSKTGTSYWHLYSDITEDKECQTLFSKNCEGFHEDEIRVTTEYIHSEL